MARWNRGEADIQALLAAGELQQLSGAAANGERLVARAGLTLETAQTAIKRDHDSAFVLAYDAARQALTALLAYQGLRPTTKGGHYAIERAARAQFGPGMRQFGALRRRRNELEYPERPDDDATIDEATEAVANATAIVRESHRPARTLLTSWTSTGRTP